MLAFVEIQKVMATRYPRIATGAPGGIANKIYRHQNISKPSRETREIRHREIRTEKHSRTSSDRSDLTEESDDFETNSEIMRNFTKLDRNNHHQRNHNKLRDNLTDYLDDRGKFHSMLEERRDREEIKKPRKPNHYVPFDPRESPRRDRRKSQGWSDSSQYEDSNYNSETGTITRPRLPRNILIDDPDKTYESSSERSNLSLAIWSCVIVLSIIILVIIIVAIVVYLTGGKEGR